MERTLITLAIGIAIGYLIYKQGVIKPTPQVVELGDKSKELEGMQKAFEKISKLKFKDYGVYDEDTLASVNYLLKGTSGLIDNNGTINKNLVNDLSIIYVNSQKTI
jgi:hypothetical protein